VSEANAAFMKPWIRKPRDWFDGAITARRLRECTRVGARPTLYGSPSVYNVGELVVGDDFRLVSCPIRSHMFVTQGGRMRIGHRVNIGAGAALSCLGRLDIDDDVTMGDYVIVMDSDFHVAQDKTVDATPRAVHIGRGARLGHRVVVLPGSTVGSGAIVRSGSVVSGDVPDHAVVEGNPARPSLERASPSEAVSEDVPRLVMHVLGLAAVPDLSAGPGQIAEWDSLGALRLIVALEERLGVSLTDDDLRSVQSVGELVGRVEAAKRDRDVPRAPWE
jgi:acetyltransferase-like isoleucine patch superfamily enzyme